MEEQMTTKINKAELAGALTALGKLVCRMSPIQAYRAVQIEGNNNMLFFRTHNADEEIEFQMETETADLRIKIPYIAQFSEVRFLYPTTVRYMDGI